MLKTKKQRFIGLDYIVPENFEFLEYNIRDYPSFCGAGKGIGDKVVPEFIGGMRISHICHIHDESWVAAVPKSYIDFMLGNLMFAYNLLVYLSSHRCTWWQRFKRRSEGILYVLSVSTVGWGIFKNL